MNLDDFPTYEWHLSNFERAMRFNLNYCYSMKYNNEFDEKMNGIPYDEMGFPRVIKQPVDFQI